MTQCAPYINKSEKRWPAAQAADVAIGIGRMLKPFCSRIRIAGSLRRHKAFVGDIELLYVPRIGSRPRGLFDSEQFSLIEPFIQELLDQGVIQKRPKIDGSFTWGDLIKLGIHIASGIPIDLFATTEENWWVSFVIRTGSKQTNLRLTTGAQRLGRTLNAGGCGVTNADGSVTPATSEEHVFELCGVPYLEPRER
jgi:DNA polymerase/3'-5' exonuclease PolX